MKWNMFATPNDSDFSYEVSGVCAVYSGKNSESSARLITAAPELLEALEDAVALCKAHGYDMRGADQIIAKARGEG